MIKPNEYKDVRVLLIEGFTRQVLPFAKELRKLGCHVTTYNSHKLDIGNVSKYPNKKIIRFCDKSDINKTYQNLFEELKTGNYDLVIPLTDFAAILLSDHYDELSKFAYLAVQNKDDIKFATDKLKTMEVCMANNIPCPKTFKSLEEFINYDESKVKYPLVVKPRTGCAAVGFYVAKDKQDLLNYINKAEKKFGPCLIQEYIPQTDVQYKCELFIDHNGNPTSSCVFEKIRWYPIEGGSSCLNKTIDRPDIVSYCEKLLNKINWRGYADIDLIQDPRDGLPKIMEINPRITGSVKICGLAGINFPKLIVDDFLGKNLEIKKAKENVYLRYIMTDILWFLKSPKRFKSKPSWFRISPDQIFSLKDPIPFITYGLQGFKKIFDDKKRREI